MKEQVQGSSIIRAMFEEGKKLAQSTVPKTYSISAWAIPVYRRLKQ
jgi:hypothetical protein